MKQVDLSRATGIGKGSLSHYLSGNYEPKSGAIYKMARVLNVSEMWLAGYDCPKERPIEQIVNDEVADIVDAIRNNPSYR